MNKMTIEEIRSLLCATRGEAELHRTLSTTALLLLKDALGLSEFDILYGEGCEDCATLGTENCGCGEYDYSAPKDPKERLEFIAKRRLASVVRRLAQGTGGVHRDVENAIIKLHAHVPAAPSNAALIAANLRACEAAEKKTKKTKAKRAGGKS